MAADTEGARPHCRSREACAAKGKGHCRPCHMVGVVQPRARAPEARARLSRAMAETWTPEKRAALSARMKADWANPLRRVEIAAVLTSPDVKARHRAGMREAYGRPEVRARVRTALAALRARKRARAMARAAVKLAGLPMLKRNVDQAVKLLAAGLGKASVAAALRTEWGRG